MIKVGTYESLAWQRLNLLYFVWSDNSLVKTLSNCHSPTRLANSVNRKKKGLDGKRERVKTLVPCPIQTRDYAKFFHWIDKSNGAKAKYALGGESHTHGWSTKLCFRYGNMTIVNAHKIYNYLVLKHTPTHMKLGRRDAISKLVHG